MSSSRPGRLRYALALGALAVASASIGFATPLTRPRSTTAGLPDSILGAWEATSVAGFGAAGAPAYFQIDFIDRTAVLIDIDAPRARWSNLRFEYSFIGPHTIHIGGRGADDWHLRLERERLIVTSRWLHEGAAVAYSRIRIPNWPLILVGFSLFIVTLAIIPAPRLHHASSAVGPPSSENSAAQRLALIGTGIIAFPIGIWASPYVLFPPVFTFNRPPWNYMLILLVGLLAVVVGARLVIAANSLLGTSSPWIKLFLTALGAGLVGSSLLPLAAAAVNFGTRIVYGTWGL